MMTRADAWVSRRSRLEEALHIDQASDEVARDDGVERSGYRQSLDIAAEGSQIGMAPPGRSDRLEREIDADPVRGSERTKQRHVATAEIEDSSTRRNLTPDAAVEVVELVAVAVGGTCTIRHDAA
jgi:hypothetical protein